MDRAQATAADPPLLPLRCIGTGKSAFHLIGIDTLRVKVSRRRLAHRFVNVPRCQLL